MILKTSINFVPGLLLAGVFSGLAIAGPFFVLLAINPMLAIIGVAIAIYLFARLAFVNFMVVVERLTPLEAIKRSFSFSRPLTLKTISILLIYIPISIIGGLLSTLAQTGGLPVQLVVDVAVAFFGLFVNVALFRLYMVARDSDEIKGNLEL